MWGVESWIKSYFLAQCVFYVFNSLLGGKIGDFLSSATTQREFLAPQISMSRRIAEWTHVRHNFYTWDFSSESIGYTVSRMTRDISHFSALFGGRFGEEGFKRGPFKKKGFRTKIALRTSRNIRQDVKKWTWNILQLWWEWRELLSIV